MKNKDIFLFNFCSCFLNSSSSSSSTFAVVTAISLILRGAVLLGSQKFKLDSREELFTGVFEVFIKESKEKSED